MTVVFCITVSLVFFFLQTKQKPEAPTQNLPYYASNEIKVESQDYIDTYINWQFNEIDDKAWTANFNFREPFWSDLKKCLNDQENLGCWQNLQKNYFPTYGLVKIKEDLLNLRNYPLVSLTDNIEFSDFQIDLENGKGSFNIIFPEGFKNNEKAKFGFGTTQINTAQANPFDVEKTNICRSPNKIHVAWKYSSTNIGYANSSDGITWMQNTSFHVNSSGSGERVYEPTIDCQGNNITVVIPVNVANDLVVMISGDEGETWKRYTPIVNGVIRYLASV